MRKVFAFAKKFMALQTEWKLIYGEYILFDGLTTILLGLHFVQERLWPLIVFYYPQG